MNPVRKIFDILESLHEGKKKNMNKESFRINFIFLDADLGQCIQLETITTADVERVLSTTKPSARAFKDKYTEWQKEFESV